MFGKGIGKMITSAASWLGYNESICDVKAGSSGISVHCHFKSGNSSMENEKPLTQAEYQKKLEQRVVSAEDGMQEDVPSMNVLNSEKQYSRVYGILNKFLEFTTQDMKILSLSKEEQIESYVRSQFNKDECKQILKWLNKNTILKAYENDTACEYCEIMLKMLEPMQLHAKGKLVEKKQVQKNQRPCEKHISALSALVQQCESDSKEVNDSEEIRDLIKKLKQTTSAESQRLQRKRRHQESQGPSLKKREIVSFVDGDVLNKCKELCKADFKNDDEKYGKIYSLVDKFNQFMVDDYVYVNKQDQCFAFVRYYMNKALCLQLLKWVDESVILQAYNNDKKCHLYQDMMSLLDAIQMQAKGCLPKDEKVGTTRYFVDSNQSPWLKPVEDVSMDGSDSDSDSDSSEDMEVETACSSLSRRKPASIPVKRQIATARKRRK